MPTTPDEKEKNMLEQIDIKDQMLASALELINILCDNHHGDEASDMALKQAISTIPDRLWNDKTASLCLMSELMENRSLFDVITKRDISFPEFICGLLPDAFWNNKDALPKATRLITDYIVECFSELSCDDFQAIFDYIPEDMWQDRAFGLEMARIIAARQSLVEWTLDFEALIPEAFLNNKNNLFALVSTILASNPLNAVEFGLIPSVAWQYSEIIFLILRNLEEQLSGDGFTMYPLLRGSRRDYLDMLFDFIPDKFRSDREFIFDLLDHDFFYDDFDIIYNWIDEGYWSDRSFILEILELDGRAVVFIPEEIVFDEQVRAFISENVDLDYVDRSCPERKKPAWMREYRI